MICLEQIGIGDHRKQEKNMPMFNPSCESGLSVVAQPAFVTDVCLTAPDHGLFQRKYRILLVQFLLTMMELHFVSCEGAKAVVFPRE
jgi:hypothetical protein